MVVVRDDGNSEGLGSGAGGVLNGGLGALLSSVSTTVDTWMREYSSPSVGDGEENAHPNTQSARAVGKSGRGFGAIYIPVTPGASKRAKEEREREEAEERARLEADLDLVPCVRLTRFQGAIPRLDFGDQVPIGGGGAEGRRGRTRRFRVENMDAGAATVEMERAPRAQQGFSFAVAGARAAGGGGSSGVNWPDGGVIVGGEDDCLVTVTWVPTEAGPVRETVQLRWGSFGRVQVVLHGTAVDALPASSAEGTLQSNSSKEGARGVSRANLGARSRLGPVRPEFLGERVPHSAAESTTPNRLPLREVKSSTSTLRRDGGTAGGRLSRGITTTKRKVLGTRLDLSRVGATRGGNAASGAVSNTSRLSTASTDTSTTTTSKHAHLARWMEKQESALTEWLNHTLLGDGNEDDDLEEGEAVSGADDRGEEKFSVTLPSSLRAEENGSGSKSGRRRSSFSYAKFASAGALLSLKKRVADLFNRDGDFRTMFARVEEGVDAGKLQVREDSTSLLGDVNLRKRATRTLVHGYTSFWLRVGLEVVLGERVPLLEELAPSPGLHSEADALSEYVQTRLFASKAVEQEFRTCASVKGLHRQGYARALGEVVLKRLLLLVKVLDTAVTCDFLGGGASTQPSNTPLLFRRMASVKSSEAMLVALVGDNTLLHGEGDVLRHLGFLGYKLHVKQSSAHEYDYTVRNLAVDLRDGVRLSRLYALLSSKETDVQRAAFLEGVRVPATDRSDRVHNLTRVFAKLKRAGMALNAGDGEYLPKLAPSSGEGALICVDDVLDGHRERTFGLLWRIMINWQLPRLIDRAALEREIARVKNGKSRRALAAESKDAENDPLCVYIANDDIGLLMEWAQAVCGHFGMRVQNFTSAWQDGRAFCYLIAFYHRTLLNVSEVYAPMGDAAVRATIAKRLDGERGQGGEAQSSGFSTSYDMTRREDLLGSDVGGVAANFALLSRKLDALGGVPSLVRPADGIVRGAKDNELDEKVVIAFVSFLCARLLATSSEVRAARCIQLHWRLHVDQMRVSSLETAACVLQRALRRYLTRSTERRHRELVERASAKLVHHFRTRKDTARAHAAADASRRESATILIQAWLRGLAARTRFKNMKRAAVCIQAACLRRMLRRQQAVDEKVSKVLSKGLVQRGILVERRRQARERRALQEELIASMLARCLERSAARKEMVQHSLQLARKRSAAATKLCEAWKLFLIRKRVKEIRSHARESERLELATRAAAARVVQSWWRTHSARTRTARLHTSASFIQRAWREHMAVFHTRRLQEELDTEIRLAACTTIQATMKMRLYQRHYRAQRAAAIVIQAAFKGYQTRSILAAIALQEEASVVIQTSYRMRRARVNFMAARLATIKIQANFRGHRTRRILSEMAVQELRAMAACITIQSAFRARESRSEYLAMRRSAVCIQANFRGHKVRSSLRAEERSRLHHQAILNATATKIQAAFRGFVGKVQYHALLSHRHDSACRIQAAVRAKAVRTELAIKQRSAITIQRAFLEHMISRRLEAVRMAERARADMVAARHAAASCIQAAYFRHAIAVQLRSERARDCAARAIQASYRTHVLRSTFLTARKAALVIQRSARQRTNRRDVRLMRLYLREEQERAVKCIQDAFRRFRSRQSLESLHRASILIQRSARCWLHRRQAAVLEATAVVLQRRWRLHTAWALFRMQRKSTLRIQAAIRGAQARWAYQNLQRATCTVQQHFRKRQANRMCQQRRELAVTAMQKSLRACIVRREFLQLRTTVITLQRRWRLHSTWNLFCLQRKNTIRIQSWVRMHLARKRHLPELCRAKDVRQAEAILECERQEIKRAAAASRIQAMYRGQKMAKTYQSMRRAAVVVQRAFIGLTVRRQAEQLAAEAYEKKHAAAALVQTTFRAHRTRKVLRATRQRAARVIQRRYIQHLIEKHVAAHSRRREACRVLQAAWRGLVHRREYLALRRAAMALQLRVRCKQECLARARCAQRSVHAARRIQAAWRFYAARIVVVHAPILQDPVAKPAPEPVSASASVKHGVEVPSELGVETAKAIAALAPEGTTRGALPSKELILPSALRACTTLAETARASLECAREVVDGGVVPVMLQFVRGCDRSPAQVRLLELALSILRSLCAHEVLRESIFSAHREVVDILAEQLQMYRDMDAIFLKALSVLERLSTTDRTRARKILGMDNLVKRMDMIARLLDAKEVMQRKYCARLDLVASTTPHLLTRATRSWKSVATQAKRMHALIAGIHHAAR